MYFLISIFTILLNPNKLLFPIGGEYEKESYEDSDQSPLVGREATVARYQWGGNIPLIAHIFLVTTLMGAAGAQKEPRRNKNRASIEGLG
jgi:hypothetical protein